MAKFGFLSHSDMSIYFFRSPIMRRLQQLGHEVVAIFPDGEYSQAIKKEFNVAHYELDKASLNPLKIGANTRNLSEILRELNLDPRINQTFLAHLPLDAQGLSIY